MDTTTQAHVDPATNPFAGAQQPTLGSAAAAGYTALPTASTGFQSQTQAQAASAPHAVPAPVPTPAEINASQNAPAREPLAGRLAGKGTATPAAAGIRQRVNKLSTSLGAAAGHPAVQNAKGVAARQTQTLREKLGRSKAVVDLERRTGVDRVVLVVGGVLLYILLIPFNIFRLALPTTQFLTIVPASYLAAQVLEAPETTANDDKVKSLLSFFVVLGAVQTLESLMAGILEKRIPQYYTVKLLFLAYLLHPRTQGAKKIHEAVLRPIVKSRNSPLSESYVPPTTTKYDTPSSTASPTGATSLRSSRPAGATVIDGSGTSTQTHQNNPFAPSSSTIPTAGLATSNTSAPQIPTLTELQNAAPPLQAQAQTSFGLDQSSGSTFPPPRVQAQQALAQAVHDTGVPTASSGYAGPDRGTAF